MNAPALRKVAEIHTKSRLQSFRIHTDSQSERLEPDMVEVSSRKKKIEKKN